MDRTEHGSGSAEAVANLLCEGPNVRLYRAGGRNSLHPSGVDALHRRTTLPDHMGQLVCEELLSRGPRRVVFAVPEEDVVDVQVVRALA